MNDLETAAQEWWIAETKATNKKSFDRYMVYGSKVKLPELNIQVIEYTAYAKALKRIEELEAKVEQYANNILIHDKRATGHLRDYNLERQISKLLEEALKENCLCSPSSGISCVHCDTLSEVQKLRDNKS